MYLSNSRKKLLFDLLDQLGVQAVRVHFSGEDSYVSHDTIDCTSDPARFSCGAIDWATTDKFPMRCHTHYEYKETKRNLAAEGYERYTKHRGVITWRKQLEPSPIAERFSEIINAHLQLHFDDFGGYISGSCTFDRQQWTCYASSAVQMAWTHEEQVTDSTSHRRVL